MRFVIAEEEAKRLWNLMSIDDHKLMMLFVVADERGKGVGSKLLEYGIAAHAISEFTVNGQSPQAMCLRVLHEALAVQPARADGNHGLQDVKALAQRVTDRRAHV